MSATIPPTVCPGRKCTSTMIVQMSGTYGGSTSTESAPRPPQMEPVFRGGERRRAGAGGEAHSLGRHDDAGEAALHVLHPVAVQAIALETRRPRIAPPAPGERVDVGVPVEHQAGPATRPAQRGDRLESPGLDLLKLHVVAARAEEVGEEARDGRLLGLEAGDANERAREVDQLSRVDVGQDGARQVVHAPP